ncbi:DNA polymerase, partial [Methylobacterium sp. CG08_land_8_20_14_0_20_71_15]
MNMHNPVQVEPRTVLVDARNPEVIDEIRALIQSSQFVGFDLETEDSRRHDGLTRFCKYNDEGFKSKTSKTVFDWRRTTICGASFYSEERPDRAYYINFGHSDAENRLPIGLLLDLLKALPAENAHFIAHNSAFEQTVIKAVLDYDFPPGSIICSMTQAVSAYGPDTYSLEAWLAAGQGDIGQLVEGLIRNCHGFDRETGEMSPALSELVFKIIGKSSKASFSWNGFVAAIAYGYGLKQAVRSHFGVQMRTFEDTLDGEAHMGLVTGEQVAAYGADDAYWAVRLFRHLLAYMMRNGGPTLVKTFFEQENVMPAIFSSIAIGGMRVNAPAIRQRTEAERATAAGILREMKAAARNFSWPGELVPELLKRESWYVKNAATYRERVQIWLDASDSDDDYEQALQVRGPVTNAWAAEHGVNEKKLLGVNLSHYMPVRTILYDLLGCKVVVSKGKVASDGEARGRIVDRLKDGKHLSKEQLEQAWAELQAELAVRIEAGGEDALAAGIALEEQQARWTRIQAEEKPSREDLEPFALHHNRYALKVIDCLNRLAGVEQRMKLYLTPYSMLVDPETGRMYPQVTSLLATRRLAASSPNAMQLGKRGEAAYVRGFYVADYDDHLMVSLDWSGVELVEIGEFSGDPEFHKAFGQIPHQDLHAGTATALLSLDCPGMNLELFKSLKGMTSWNEWLSDHHGEADRLPRLMTNLKGELLESAKAYGYWRTVFGKEANFNYFYSGWLATIGERAGWSPQKTADATDAYRAQFPVAEAWRVQQISDVNMLGYVTLPDG